ncbi:MAG TPA: hypothetical protein GYA08_09535 [Chloroflexi bacterium]|nr:hypothetical protein [Chloroflexota bacterium]
MLNAELVREIEAGAQTFWESEVQKAYFVELAQGKEIGHRIADLVDDKTTGWLAVNYLTRYQRDRRGNKLPRSMGDIWIEDEGIYHPINVKTGVSSTNGQPNMVSMKKLLDALLNYQIDSYYLLMVKLDIQQSILCNVHFVDMLDYLDYVTFDSGPGQIMLKSRAFFAARSSRTIPLPRTIGQKVQMLVDLLEDGERRLVENRKRSLEIYRQRAQQYADAGSHRVTAETQEALLLG